MSAIFEAVSLAVRVPSRGSAPRLLFDGVSFAAASGESVALEGRSGSGKSSLLAMCAWFISPGSGDVLWDGHDVRSWSSDRRARWRRQHAGYLDQDSQMIPELTMIENAVLPARRADKALLMRATTLFEELGIAHLAQARPYVCSGGERQRAGIARALVTEPALILLDEPTASLDSVSAGLVLGALRRHRDAGAAIVVATHDRLVLDWAAERVELDS